MENKTSNLDVKKDCINLIASISLSIVSFVFVAKLISVFYKPDISLIWEKANALLISGMLKTCNPEPLEKTLFILGILAIPGFLFAYYLILKKIIRNKSEYFIHKIWMLICLYTSTIIPLIIFIIMTTQSIYINPNLYFYIYFHHPTANHISIFLFVPCIIILYYLLKNDYPPETKSGNIVTMIFYSICVLFILYISAINIFSIFTSNFHFDSVFYSIVQLFKGIPLGVDGFTNNYGLYPYFLNIIFKIIGLSVLKCSFVFCILIFLSFLLILFFLKNTVNNKLLVFLGFISVVYLPNLSYQVISIRITGNALPYYQYLPIRYIFPCLLLFLGSLYIKSGNKYLYIISSVVCSLALLWNFDTGIVTLLSWILLNLYSEFESKEVGTIFKNSLQHLAKILSIMITTILFFLFVVFIFYGRILDPGSLIHSYFVFSQLSYYMLPMPLLHPWNILALTYITGMGISVRAMIEKDITPWTKNMFLVTIMGTGMLLYYQGRSHDLSLFGPSFYFFILLTLFLDKILFFLKNNKNFIFAFLSILISTVLSLSIVLIIINHKEEYALLNNSLTNIQAPSPEKNIIQTNCDFIKSHTSPSEKIIIFSADEATYFSRIPNASAFDPSFFECYLKTDYDRFERLVSESDIKIFSAENYIFIVDAFSGIMKYLEIVDSNGNMDLLMRKRVKY